MLACVFRSSRPPGPAPFSLIHIASMVRLAPRQAHAAVPPTHPTGRIPELMLVQCLLSYRRALRRLFCHCRCCCRERSESGVGPRAAAMEHGERDKGGLGHGESSVLWNTESIPHISFLSKHLSNQATSQIFGDPHNNTAGSVQGCARGPTGVCIRSWWNGGTSLRRR